jgi:cytochrome b involved in lipid metabolism
LETGNPKKVDKLFTKDEVDQAVADGQMLLIMDNLVIDAKTYAMRHPGGRFTIEKNAGRDISKFFYGGYAMLNEKNDKKPHTHSKFALD